MSHEQRSRTARILNRIDRLQRGRIERDHRRSYVAEGVRNFIAVCDGRVPIEAIVHAPPLLQNDTAAKLVRHRRRDGVPTFRVSPEQFRSVSRTERASGLAAIVRYHSEADLPEPTMEPTFWLVLNRIRKPGNLGCLLRSSRALGGAGLMLIGDAIDPYDPAVVRAAMGALVRQRIVRTSWRPFRAWVAQRSGTVLGASPDGTLDLAALPASMRAITAPGTVLLMLGDERTGLDPAQRELCDRLVRIPMRDGTDSLNVGVAGALVMAEVMRPPCGAAPSVGRVVSTPPTPR